MQAIRRLAEEHDGGLRDVGAVTFATQTNSFVLLDGMDRPLTPLILWPDRRAADEEDAIIDRFKAVYGHPGGTFLIFTGICLACSLFVWRLLPETKDKTLEEIGSYWLRLSSAARRR